MTLLDLSGYPGLAAAVADQLRTAIAEGSLRPGQRLIQEDLAQSLGISREPIRQALRLLEAEGLVVHRPRRGAIVAPLTEAEVRNVYDIRAALDGLAARRTAGRLSPAEVKELNRLLASGRRLVAKGDVTQLLAADRSFHQFLQEASGNHIALEIGRKHWNRIAVVVRALLEGGYAQRAWAEHQTIADFIIAGDADQASELARLHAWRAADAACAQLAATREAAG